MNRSTVRSGCGVGGTRGRALGPSASGQGLISEEDMNAAPSKPGPPGPPIRTILGVHLVEGRAVGWLYDRGNQSPEIDRLVFNVRLLAFRAMMNRKLAPLDPYQSGITPAELAYKDASIQQMANNNGLYFFDWPKPFTSDQDGSYCRRLAAACKADRQARMMVFY